MKKPLFQNWTIPILQDKKKNGKIMGYVDKQVTKRKFIAGGRIIAKHYPKKNKALEYISWNLWHWCNEHAVQLQEEYVFDEVRKYRYDFAIPSLKLAIEFEGDIHKNVSGHTSAKGVQRDIEKYNLAQSLGWKVLRLHSENYETLITELNKLV